MSEETGYFERRVGTTLCGKWTLERLLGVGGMAAVYEASHARLGRRDAVKILHPEIAHSLDARQRFEQEARAVNHLRHPGAVEVRDIEVSEDGAPFLVMELLDGESLASSLMRRGPLPYLEVFQAAAQVLDVLAAAHAVGIIHRDIKPDNLFLLRDGRIKVLDFGVARLRQRGGDGVAPTRTGALIGTVAYMAPEQVSGRTDLDGRADVFAVGATLFRLITGRHLHPTDNDLQLIMQMASEPAPPLRSIAPAVPEPFAYVVDRALAFNRDQRYPDAAAMRADILQLVGALPLSTTPIPSGLAHQPTSYQSVSYQPGTEPTGYQPSSPTGYQPSSPTGYQPTPTGYQPAATQGGHQPATPTGLHPGGAMGMGVPYAPGLQPSAVPTQGVPVYPGAALTHGPVTGTEATGYQPSLAQPARALPTQPSMAVSTGPSVAYQPAPYAPQPTGASPLPAPASFASPLPPAAAQALGRPITGTQASPVMPPVGAMAAPPGYAPPAPSGATRLEQLGRRTVSLPYPAVVALLVTAGLLVSSVGVFMLWRKLSKASSETPEQIVVPSATGLPTQGLPTQGLPTQGLPTQGVQIVPGGLPGLPPGGPPGHGKGKKK